MNRLAILTISGLIAALAVPATADADPARAPAAEQATADPAPRTGATFGEVIRRLMHQVEAKKQAQVHASGAAKARPDDLAIKRAVLRLTPWTAPLADSLAAEPARHATR